ncbi:hypothetical protein Tco_0031935 [Tanacetum coccineum]
MMPTTSKPINTTTTTNVAQNVVDENLPELLDLRGGSHVTNVPAFNKENFTSWKIRFLVFLDGLGPYLLKTLEDGPFFHVSSLSTSKNPLPKRQNQWSNAKSRLCKTIKEMWNDPILAREGPCDIRDTKIAALRLKFNAFKSLEGEKYNDSDVEEDQRTNNEFMANLNAEYHERALLANQKRFYKRSRRIGSARKPIDKSKETCFACGKTRKNEKGKSEKGLIAESFVWDEESVSSKDEGTTKIRDFMAIVEDEPSVGKADTRSGQ